MKTLILIALILSSQVHAADVTGPQLQPNLRGLSCESFEFAELDSMDRDSLEGLACTYPFASALSRRSRDVELSRSPDARTQVMLSERHAAKSGACLREQVKTWELFKRKFATKVDCTKFPPLPPIPAA